MNTDNDNPAWHELVDEYTEAYGTTPGLALDIELADLYAKHPTVTRAKLRDTAEAYTAGRVHSPWGFAANALREHDKIRDTLPEATDRSRERSIDRAERWTRIAGIHCPTADELEDALFGDHGRLRDYRDDTKLKQRLVDLYNREHPRAIAADQAMLERAQRWRDNRSKTESRLGDSTTPPPPGDNVASGKTTVHSAQATTIENDDIA